MELDQAEKAKAQKMHRVGILMNLLMGISLSLALSLIGSLTSGHFTLIAWLVSFAASTVLSLLIGFLLPVRKCALGLCAKLNLRERSLPSLAVESFISDIFYTPLITLLMVFLGWKSAVSHGAQIPFLPMYLKSLALTFLCGYVLIFVLQPLYLRLILGKEKVVE